MLPKNVESGSSYGRLKMANSAAVETAMEIWQTIESACQKNASNPEWDKTEVWLGNTMREDGALIDPARIKEIAEKRKAENEIAKERRKAREEVALLPPKKW